MPIYEYRCAANDRTVEVRHGMGEKLRTWGELCERAGLDVGDLPASAPVERLLSAALVSQGTRSPPEACGPACHCAGLEA
jgi:hypothetical protein